MNQLRLLTAIILSITTYLLSAAGPIFIAGSDATNDGSVIVAFSSLKSGSEFAISDLASENLLIKPFGSVAPPTRALIAELLATTRTANDAARRLSQSGIDAKVPIIVADLTEIYIVDQSQSSAITRVADNAVITDLNKLTSVSDQRVSVDDARRVLSSDNDKRIAYNIIASLNPTRARTLRTLILYGAGTPSTTVYIPLFASIENVPKTLLTKKAILAGNDAADVERMSRALNDSIGVDLKVAIEQFPDFEIDDRRALVQDLADIWAEKLAAASKRLKSRK